MDNPILEAVKFHFMAKKSEALARINIYVRNPIGVGDHSNIVEEVIKAMEDLDHSDSCLASLDSLAGPQSQESDTDGSIPPVSNPKSKK